MQTIDTRSSLRIAILLEMLEEVSRASSPEEAVAAYGNRIWKVRPIDHYLGVSVRNLPEGQYKITRRNRNFGRGPERRAAPNPWRDWETIPTHTSGFIGEMIAVPEPRLLHNLSVTNDAALGDSIADMGSALVIPLFDGGVLNWSFMFRKHPEGYNLDDLEQNLLAGNLFGSMTRNLVTTEQVRRLNASLHRQFEEVARVQQALLPERIPAIPGLKIATSYLTSEQAGGDYYDFFELPGGRWGFLIADVAGHGPGAATVMAMLHAILHAYPDIHRGPDAALRFANERLLAARGEGSFVTAFFGIFDPRTRGFAYSRAGHPLPRVKDTKSGEVTLLDGEAGLPLGIVPDLHLETNTTTLRPGQTVVLYTDGITESFNRERRMFGSEGLDDALHGCSGEPDCIVDSIHAALFKHTGLRTRDDDQTIVVFKVIEEAQS